MIDILSRQAGTWKTRLLSATHQHLDDGDFTTFLINVADTDVSDTDVSDTDMLDTDMSNIDMSDTDMAATDVSDTDM